MAARTDGIARDEHGFDQRVRGRPGSDSSQELGRGLTCAFVERAFV